MSADKVTPVRRRGSAVLRALRLILWLYLFMVSVKMMGAGFKTIGTQVDLRALLAGAAATPLMGVCIGLLVTAVVQSSSFTTAMLVTLVAAGTIDLTHAVPMIMGANIGTTITNSFVATAHIARRREFQLAFSAGTMHDIFNILTLAILLPLEVLFHPLERIASFLTLPIKDAFGGEGGTLSRSPLDIAVMPPVEAARGLLEGIVSNPSVVGSALLLCALVLLFVSLSRMVVVLRQVFIGGLERVINEFLFSRWWAALLFGIVLTFLVQSSSMTVSLLVPLVASGVLTMEAAFPFTLGANIGTTVTAFLAGLVAGSHAGIALALTHLLFNVGGAIIFLPLRGIPIFLSRRLAEVVYRRRWFALVYIGVVFFLVPIAVLAISKAVLR